MTIIEAVKKLNATHRMRRKKWCLLLVALCKRGFLVWSGPINDTRPYQATKEDIQADDWEIVEVKP